MEMSVGFKFKRLTDSMVKEGVVDSAALELTTALYADFAGDMRAALSEYIYRYEYKGMRCRLKSDEEQPYVIEILTGNKDTASIVAPSAQDIPMALHNLIDTYLDKASRKTVPEVGDYVCGTEILPTETRQTCGWVVQAETSGKLLVACDDEFEGSRATYLEDLKVLYKDAGGPDDYCFNRREISADEYKAISEVYSIESFVALIACEYGESKPLFPALGHSQDKYYILWKTKRRG